MGGVVVGAGGLFFPQALGVGYNVIADLLRGNMDAHAMLGIFIVKWIIWAVALGSGASGGVLAPLLMIGGALRGLASGFLPGEGAGFWQLVCMGSVEDRAAQHERGEGVRDRRADQERNQHIDVVRELEREHHGGEGRAHGPAEQRSAPHTPMGYVALNDLLKVRVRRLDEERRRERVLGRRRRTTTSE